MISTLELARQIHRHPQTVRSWAEAKLIPGQRRNGHRGEVGPWLFDLEAVRKAMKEQNLHEGQSNEK